MRIWEAIVRLQEIQKLYPDIELKYEDIHDWIYRRLEGLKIHKIKIWTIIDWKHVVEERKFILCF